MTFVGYLASAAGNPPIQLPSAKTPNAAELRDWQLIICRERITRALACPQIGGNLIYREDLIRLVAHLLAQDVGVRLVNPPILAYHFLVEQTWATQAALEVPDLS
jgi:hypothetical protein